MWFGKQILLSPFPLATLEDREKYLPTPNPHPLISVDYSPNCLGLNGHV